MDGKKQEITEAVGARIRQLRKARGLSQEELALRSELSPAYFGLVERGIKCPSIETIWKVAAGLGVSPSELLRVGNASCDLKEYIRRIEELLQRVPEEKLELILKVIEDIVGIV